MVSRTPSRDASNARIARSARLAWAGGPALHCLNCGAALPLDSRFCAACGAKLPLNARLAPWAKVAIGLLAFLIGCLGFLTAFAAVTLPDVNRLGAAAGAVQVLDRSGQVIAEVGPRDVNRKPVPLSQVSPIMRRATLAAEDRQFYREGAFDLPRLLKAMAVDILSGGAAQGASTITQQLARDTLLTPEKSVVRKLREALLAQQINARYSKDQILEMYLNDIYYGQGAYGIEAAAETYFGKSATQLDLAEATLLAGLPSAPSYADPFVNPGVALNRQQYVLEGLVAMGTISRQQADFVEQKSDQQVLLAQLRPGSATANDPAPHFVHYVEDLLRARFGSDSSVFNGTLSVTTTLDLSIQQTAQRAVSQGIAQLGRGANNGALLMIDAHSGDILAMVGSANYNDASIAGQFNAVTGQQQPGSSFKPYVYAEAFAEQRLTPQSILDDTPQESAALGGVQDWDHGYFGRISAEEALLQSRNIATEQAAQRAGIDNVIAFAHSLGISSPLASNLSTAIGSSSVSMFDQAGAYAAFANGGFKVTPRAILKVVDGQGRVLINEPAPAHGPQVMSTQVACTMDGILRNYPATWNLGFDRPTAGKSGTTDNFVDAWYMSYTPDWVVATWAGHTSGTSSQQVGMNGVWGTMVGEAVAVPFVNALAGGSHDFGCGGQFVQHGRGGGPSGGGHHKKH